jgi:hypothetical protein
MKKILIFISLTSLLLLSGCASNTIPPEALQFQPDTLSNRQLQSRKYDIKTEKELLGASSAVLQDMGFNLDESNTTLGVIVASKSRDARDGGQIAGAVLMGVLFGANAVTYDKDQKIRASLVTKPADGSKGYMVRVTFQRLVWNQKGILSKIEGINEKEIYQEFYDKLSKSVFLQAQNVE